MKKRLPALLLAAALLIGLMAGCSKTATNSGTQDASGPSGSATTAAQISAKYAYQVQELPLTLENCNYMDRYAVGMNNDFYICASIMTDPGSEGNTSDEVLGDDYAVPAATAEATATIDISAGEWAEKYPDAVTEYVAPTYEMQIFRLDCATGDITRLDSYQTPALPEGHDGYTNITYMNVAADGSLWIADQINSYYYDLPENFDPYTQYESDYYVEGLCERNLYHYSPDGTLLAKIQLPQPDESNDMMEVVSIDEAGNIYCADYNTAYILSSDGTVVHSLELDGSSLYDFCGKPALQVWDGTMTIQLIDTATFSAGEVQTMPSNAWSFMPSYDPAYDFYYQNNYNVYGYKSEEQASEKVLDYIDCDIDPGYITLTQSLPDGRFLALKQEYDYDTYDETNTVLLLTPVDPSTMPQKQVLTLACLYINYDLRQQIIQFNKSSQTTRITINDYSQYTDEDGNSAALTKLNTEILSGKVSDLFLTDGLPITQYAAQGVLEDLLPWLEQDVELSYDQLMTNVVDAASVDGKLYQAFSEFSINTAMVMPQIAAQYDTWTLDAVESAMQQLQPDASIFSVGYTRDDVLSSCVGNALNKFVDWNTGECHFDTQEFKDLLAFANKFPAEFDWENYDWSQNIDSYTALRTGMQLMFPTSIWTLTDYLWTLAALGGDIVLTGYPSQTGDGNWFNFSTSVAISSKCADKEAAWQFVRTLFTADYQREREYYGIPSNATVFNERLTDAMTLTYQTDESGEYILDENGEKVVDPKAIYWDENGEELVIDVMTQAQADELMRLYNSVTTIGGSNDAIYNIVTEEAGAYFAGQRSLDDVAGIIQNRVGLYVAEQK